jgi:hypothetical protein
MVAPLGTVPRERDTKYLKGRSANRDIQDGQDEKL